MKSLNSMGIGLIPSKNSGLFTQSSFYDLMDCCRVSQPCLLNLASEFLH